jgi:alpha-tubulin suppressor-like RCC1 family protein
VWHGDAALVHQPAAGRRIGVGCWGAGGTGVGGGGVTGSDISSADIAGGWPMLGTGISGGPGGPPRDIECATFHCCVVRHAGQVVCWGAWQDIAAAASVTGAEAASVLGGAMHPFGDPTTVAAISFAPLVPESNVLATAVLSVSLSMVGTCTLHGDGAVRCFGLGPRGELGRDSGPEVVGYPMSSLGTPGRHVRMSAVRAIRYSDTAPAVAIASGHFFNCAVFSPVPAGSRGNVRCWGANDRGQLGTDSNSAQVGLSPAASVSALDYINFLITPGSATDTAVEVVAGATHACALFVSGGVRCWGSNGHGELGRDDTVDTGAGLPGPLMSTLGYVQFADPAVHGRMDAVALSAGAAVSCAAFAADTSTAAGLLDSALKVRCWGDGVSNGTTGDGVGATDYGSGPAGDSVAAAPFVDGLDYTSGTGAPMPHVAITPHLGCSQGDFPIFIHGAPGTLRHLDLLRISNLVSSETYTVGLTNLTAGLSTATLPKWETMFTTPPPGPSATTVATLTLGTSRMPGSSPANPHFATEAGDRLSEVFFCVSFFFFLFFFFFFFY